MKFAYFERRGTGFFNYRLKPSNLHPFDSLLLLFTAPVSFGHFPDQNRLKLKMINELI